jgi:feruloyl esterase
MAVMFVATFFAAKAAAASPCEKLGELALANARVTSSQVVAAGSFSAPGPPRNGLATLYSKLPEFCRVQATLTPTSDSSIKVEIWLPTSHWNGKFQAVGNGGWAGVISYSQMAEALRDGYATASTDTGHSTQGAAFVLNHPEKLADFAWRSEHEMTVQAKTVVAAFYGEKPKYSYWNGCSTGGRQALKEAQMFPNDYDGIIAGAPANRSTLSLWIAQAMLMDPASMIPAEKYPVIHQAALAACDAKDGLKDGLISDPASCSLDPAVLLCKEGDKPTCLTAPQVAAAKKMYAPPTNPRTGKKLSEPLTVGTELGWGEQVLNGKPNTNILDHYQDVVYKNPNWDWKTFNFDTDAARSDLPENTVMNATDPHLAPFFAHDGKLLMYQGWSDPRVPALQTIDYYKSVLDATGGSAKVSNNIRLFMAPGMSHCGGGEGPNVFDKIDALDAWVTTGKAPDKLIASHMTAGKVDRTRPLCPYPQIAMYKGAGSIDDAASFVCRVP